jgi:Zn-finger nucleic acid-binding protein
VQGVEIDLCPRGDGLWFDRSEMNLVIDSFREGEAGAAARFFGDFFSADRRKED